MALNITKFDVRDATETIVLNTICPSKENESLEKVENGYIEEHAEKYGKKLLNVRSNPNKKVKRIEFQVKMENEKQLRERIAKLDKTLTIKEDKKKSLFYFDTIIDGKRHHTYARYIKCSQDEALKKHSKKKKKRKEKKRKD